MTIHRKKLIEVALPLAAINEASAKEKSIRHGHPSTLHLWWARRPLAACRAVLFAQFVDDPSSVPGEFPDEAAQDAERKRLFGIIERLVAWKNSNDELVLADARREIARSVARSRSEAPPDDHDIKVYLAENAPPVVDPFCGGGSIPLEAQRLGLRAYGSDLNPVAVLISKALVEIPPCFAGRTPVNPDSRASIGGSWATHGASGLAVDVRFYGQWMRDEAEKRIGHLYPKVEVTPGLIRGRSDMKAYKGHKLTVIAWLWARTVASPNPVANGAHVPLVSSFVLSSRKGKEVIVVPVVEHGGYRFTVKSAGISPDELAKARNGTKTGRGANFTCLVSGAPLASAYIKSEGMARRIDAKLMAVVAEGKRGRVYLSPNPEMELAAYQAEPTWRPEQDLPKNPRWFSPPDYGMPQYADLFTDRQLVALTTFSDLVAESRRRVLADALAALPARPENGTRLAKARTGASAYADALATYLAFGVDRLADRLSSACGWDSGYVKIRNTFGRQALPMVWDYAEGNPFSDSTGSWTSCVDWVSKVIAMSPHGGLRTTVVQNDAASTDLPSGVAVATDPPYYDNIGYADLSDFFYVWLRRAISPVHSDLFKTLLTPKADELVATPYRFGGNRAEARRFFETGLGQAISKMRVAQAAECPMTLFYAYKTDRNGVRRSRRGKYRIDRLGDHAGRHPREWIRHHRHLARPQRTEQ